MSIDLSYFGDDDELTAAEVAQAVGVHRSTVARWVGNGKLAGRVDDSHRPDGGTGRFLVKVRHVRAMLAGAQ